jgi:hypothetical protein
MLERHARHGTAHAALIADILSLLAGRKPATPPAGPPPPLEPLSDSEIRVCVPSLAYRWRMWVRTVLSETYSSPAISGPDRLVGR